MSEGVQNVSWKIGKLPTEDAEKVREFLKAQNNIQQTLTFLALHFRERFGSVDIMNFDVQRALYADLDNNKVVEASVQQSAQQPSVDARKITKNKEYNNNMSKTMENIVTADDY